jgi:SulP family sulfate permease
VVDCTFEHPRQRKPDNPVSRLRKISQATTVTNVTDDYIEDGRAHILQDKDIPGYAGGYTIHGPFLFGVTDKINTITDHLSSLPQW